MEFHSHIKFLDANKMYVILSLFTILKVFVSFLLFFFIDFNITFSYSNNFSSEILNNLVHLMLRSVTLRDMMHLFEVVVCYINTL